MHSLPKRLHLLEPITGMQELVMKSLVLAWWAKSHRDRTLCGCIQILQHLVHHGDFGIVVPSWIILICCNVYALDHTVLDEHGKPLAPRVSKSLCELAARITQ